MTNDYSVWQLLEFRQTFGIERFRCLAICVALALLAHMLLGSTLAQEAMLTGAKRIGIRPATPVIHTVGVAGLSGSRTYTAVGLPDGLSLDSSTGAITGTSPAAGTYNVAITVQDATGRAASGVLQIESGEMLAATPPMGFNSWNSFENRVSANAIRAVADALVLSGMRDAGYQFVNIDDTWSSGRDSSGRLVPNSSRFPDQPSAPGNGMEELADYVHERGLKIGIYADTGTATCAGYEGTFNHEQTDAQTFADWGIDYVKHDYCNTPEDQATAIARYTQFGQALKSSGRSIVFSLSEWGQRSPWQWARDPDGAAAHLWRTTFDMRDHWDFGGSEPPSRNQGAIGVLDALDLQVGLESSSGPGGWNDPDMMVIGVDLAGSSAAHGATGLNYAQERSHFSMWAMLSAPLILNADLRKLDPASSEFDSEWAENILPILTNHEVIAIDQDPLGAQASRVIDLGDREVWTKPLASGDYAVAFLNRSSEPADFDIELSELGLNFAYEVRDLWTHQDLAETSASLATSVAAHETRLLRLSPLLKGDVNGDGTVNHEDIDHVEVRMGEKVLITSLRDGDLDGDGVVTTADIAVVRANLINPVSVLGDINVDGMVTDADIAAFRAGWLKKFRLPGEQSWRAGDLDLNGVTDLADAVLLHRALLDAGLSSPFAGIAVPEPATGAALAIGCAWLLASKSTQSQSRDSSGSPSHFTADPPYQPELTSSGPSARKR